MERNGLLMQIKTKSDWIRGRSGMECPECSADMVLRNSRFGKFYGCSTFPLCKATHGAHPNGKPLGFPANKELKQLRMKAHRELEKHFGKWGLDIPSPNEEDFRIGEEFKPTDLL